MTGAAAEKYRKMFIREDLPRRLLLIFSLVNRGSSDRIVGGFLTRRFVGTRRRGHQSTVVRYVEAIHASVAADDQMIE